MSTVKHILDKYSKKLDYLDLELIIAHVLKKNREFVLAHPEKTVTKNQESAIKKMAKRRIEHEPLAYILGEKEFYGLKFKVDKNTLVPRPETELLVEEVLKKIRDTRYEIRDTRIIDVGTGSGNIIISIAKNFEIQNSKFEFLGIDISEEALKIARQNAKLNKVDKKIKFLQGNLLNPIIKKRSMFHVPCSMIIIANLPYLSQKIYASAPADVKKYEPKTALFSQEEGLSHYKKLLKQINLLHVPCSMFYVFLEISPEQKVPLTKFIKKLFPQAKPEFKKDLAGRWRICKIKL